MAAGEVRDCAHNHPVSRGQLVDHCRPRPTAVATIGSDEASATALCSKATTAQHSYPRARRRTDRDAEAVATWRLRSVPSGGASEFNAPPPHAAYERSQWRSFTEDR